MMLLKCDGKGGDNGCFCSVALCVSRYAWHHVLNRGTVVKIDDENLIRSVKFAPKMDLASTVKII